MVMPFRLDSHKLHLDLIFLNSLIIHKENTWEINVESVYENQMKNCLFCILKFSFKNHVV